MIRIAEKPARYPTRLVTRSGDGYVAITLPRDEPNASQRAEVFCDWDEWPLTRMRCLTPRWLPLCLHGVGGLAEPGHDFGMVGGDVVLFGRIVFQIEQHQRDRCIARGDAGIVGW